MVDGPLKFNRRLLIVRLKEVLQVLITALGVRCAGTARRLDEASAFAQVGVLTGHAAGSTSRGLGRSWDLMVSSRCPFRIQVNINDDDMIELLEYTMHIYFSCVIPLRTRRHSRIPS